LYKLIDANIKERLAIKTPDKSNICLYIKKYPKGKNTIMEGQRYFNLVLIFF